MARSKAPIRREGEAALLRRYKHELAEIRQKYESAALSMGLDDVAAELRRQARASESDYQVLAREFRREVATLKRSGLLGPEVDVRRAKPTSALSRTINELYDVVVGKAKAKKVSPKAAKKLREQGFTVRRGRVVLAPGYRVSPSTGELREASGRKVIKRIGLRADVERQLRDLWKTLRPGEYVTFDVYGNFSDVFANTEAGLYSMLGRLLAYNPQDIPRIGVLYLPDRAAAAAHAKEVSRTQLAQQRENEAARRKRSRAKAKRKRDKYRR